MCSLANDAQAQKISAFPVHEAERTDNFIIYRPSGVPVTNLRFNVDSIFSLLTVGDVSGLDTTGLWESDGTDVWWLGGNIGGDIATPATLLHLGQADGAAPDYGTKTRGLQFGQSPLGNLNLFQNTSNELQFTVDDVNKFKMSSTGLNMQSDLLPATTALYDLGGPSLNFDTLYVRDIYIDDSLMDTYIRARLIAPAAAGNQNEIQLNDAGSLGASSNFSFDDTTLFVKSSIGTNNIFIGPLSGESVQSGAVNNTFLGYNTGNTISTGDDNVFSGYNTGNSNTIGSKNTFIGSIAGSANTSGANNTYIGYNSGSSSNGDFNTFLGYSTGSNNTTGTRNLFVGYNAGSSNTDGSYNTLLGYLAGSANTSGDSSVFVGYKAGSAETEPNRLYIENSESSSPLIYGEFDNNYVKINDSLEVSKSLKFSENDDENYAKGKIYYDTTDQALVFYNDQPDFKWQMGREIPIRFYNNTGSTITNGTLLRSLGAKVNGSITFSADLAGNGSLDSLQGVAMATVQTLDGQYGEATLIGQVNGLNTSMFNDNDLLWIGSNGTVIDSAPPPPNWATIVGRVLYADNDSGAIFMFPIGETRYDPNPTFTASFEDSTEVITNPGVGEYALITSATSSLFGEKRNVGFTFQGDSISPLQAGNYTIFLSYSFQGTAVQTDLYRIGTFIDGVKGYSTSRTASGTNNGGVPYPYTIFLNAGQWISFRIANQSDASRNATMTDGTVTINYSQ